MIAKRRSTEGGVGRGGRRKRSTAWRLLGMVPRGWLVVVLAVSAASTALDAAAQDCCYCTHWQVDVWSFSAHDTCDFNGSECTCDLAEDEDECQATCLMNYNLGDLDCNGGSFEYAGRRTYTTCTHLTDINASCNGTRTSGIPAGSCLEGDPECRCAADPCDDVVCTGGRICENQDGLAACVCRDGEHRHQGAPACHGTTDTGTGHACPDNQHKHTHSVSGCGPDHTCPPGQEIYDHDKCDPWPGNGCPGTKVDRDPRPGTVVCSSSCRPNASVVQSTGVCACDDGYEVDSIGRCVAIVVDIHPNNGCDIAGRVNRNGNCDYTGCGNNADTDGNGYCVCAADYRYPNTTTLHCSQCADGSVPDGRACRMCEDGESSPGVCRDCGTHAGWNGSACVCDTCFEDTDTGDGLACAEKTCGVNEECRGGNGQCSCIASHHAHDALACHAFGEHGCPDDQHDDTHPGTCHGTHICTAPLVLEGHDSCVCPVGQHDDTHPGTCHGTHICTAPLVLEGHDSCGCPAGQHDETHPGTCHGTHICTAPLVLEGHDSCVCPAGQHDETHPGTCHGTHICTAPLVLEGHDSCVCPAGQHDETHPGTCHGTHICTAPLVLEGHDSCVCAALPRARTSARRRWCWRATIRACARPASTTRPIRAPATARTSARRRWCWRATTRACARPASTTHPSGHLPRHAHLHGAAGAGGPRFVRVPGRPARRDPSGHLPRHAHLHGAAGAGGPRLVRVPGRPARRPGPIVCEAGTCHGTHICTAPLVTWRATIVRPVPGRATHDETHRGTCTARRSASGARCARRARLVRVPGRPARRTHAGHLPRRPRVHRRGAPRDALACHDDGTEHACPDGEHKHRGQSVRAVRTTSARRRWCWRATTRACARPASTTTPTRARATTTTSAPKRGTTPTIRSPATTTGRSTPVRTASTSTSTIRPRALRTTRVRRTPRWRTTATTIRRRRRASARRTTRTIPTWTACSAWRTSWTRPRAEPTKPARRLTARSAAGTGCRTRRVPCARSVPAARRRDSRAFACRWATARGWARTGRVRRAAAWGPALSAPMPSAVRHAGPTAPTTAGACACAIRATCTRWRRGHSPGRRTASGAPTNCAGRPRIRARASRAAPGTAAPRGATAATASSDPTTAGRASARTTAPSRPATARASCSPTRSRCSTACGSASSTPRRAT